MSDDLISRRAYLVMKLVATRKANVFMAMEAVSSTALEHPEWDMAETRTWEEWEKVEAADRIRQMRQDLARDAVG